MAIKSRDLKPLVANYLRQQFNLKKEEMAYYRAIQGMNYEYWRVNNWCIGIYLIIIDMSY